MILHTQSLDILILLVDRRFQTLTSLMDCCRAFDSLHHIKVLKHRFLELLELGVGAWDFLSLRATRPWKI